MKIARSSPNLSYSATVGEWRYIQSIHETGDRHNPDHLAGFLLTLPERLRARWLSQNRLRRLRSSLFYHYLIARTRYYDQVFLDGIEWDAQYIVNLGCGSDTRAYRFLDQLTRKNVKVCEFDQAAAIDVKKQICQRRWPTRLVNYRPLDLNDEQWPAFEHWLKDNVRRPVLIIMEGVTPYLQYQAFGRFLSLLSAQLPAGSRIAYDYKISGVDDDFGREGRTQHPFRMSADRGQVAEYHRSKNLSLMCLEESSVLSARLVPSLVTEGIQLFQEDVLVQAKV